MHSLGQDPQSRPTRPRSAITLVIPLYNEEDRIRRSWPQLVEFVERQQSGSELILVDDGSHDSTVATARALSHGHERVIVRERQHRGKGAAVEHGIHLASTPLVGYTDVDLSTPLDEVERLFRLCEDERTLVIGSRGAPGARIGTHQSPRREWLGRLFNLWVQALLAPGFKDTQCGAKFAPLHVWREIVGLTGEEGFAWDAEVVALAHGHGGGVREEPIAWDHDPSTRVRVGRDGLAMGVAVVRIAVRLRRAANSRQLVSDEQ